jgi:hypothetical protein
MSKRRSWVDFGLVLIAVAIGNIIGANSYRQGGWSMVLVVAFVTIGIGATFIAVAIARR